MFKNLKVIAFDADDTLWVNEPYFQKAENTFCEMMEQFLPAHSVSKVLFKNEMKNLADYGYGVKAFILSMVETAIEISEGHIASKDIMKIVKIGKEMLHMDIELLPGIEDLLSKLQPLYRLVMVTKGDLLDQERKLMKSGLEKYFHHTEIVSEKKPAQYQKLLKHLDLLPDQFMMIGNSLKSDVLPVIEIGSIGVHIPYHTTWAHEVIDSNMEHERLFKISHHQELLDILTV